MGTLKNKIIIIITIVVAIIVGIAFCVHLIFSTGGLLLIAKDFVQVYATEDEAMTWPHPSAMATLSPGQRVQVAKCVDVKNYQIYKVILPDGRNGFVLEGNYSLMRDGKEASCS